MMILQAEHPRRIITTEDIKLSGVEYEWLLFGEGLLRGVFAVRF